MKKRGVFTEKKVAAVCAAVLVILIAFPFVRQSDFVTSIMSGVTGSGSSNDVNTNASNITSEEAQEPQTNSGVSKQAEAISEELSEDVLPQQSQQSVDNGTYTYIAKAGDSYTALVRQSIASYLNEKQYSATYADKLVAEVEITNAAGSPYLEIGDVVSISKGDIERYFTAYSLPESTTDTDVETHHTADTGTTEDSTEAFSAVAEAGDSYTMLARQAVLMNGGASLSPAQKVAAETQLATQAGFPSLLIGQVVQINNTDIRAAVDYALGLTAEQQLAWQPYSALVAW